jgi:hypothetical protein
MRQRLLSSFCVIGSVCFLYVSVACPLLAQEEPKDSCVNAIYVEGFGQGILYSVNYDHLLSRHLSVRVGFTSWTLRDFLFIDVGVVGFPMMINYLSGDHTSHFELGIGVVPAIISMQGSGTLIGTEVKGNTVSAWGSATVGYRAQSPEGGVVFRIGLTPLFTFRDATLSGGISLGFAF